MQQSIYRSPLGPFFLWFHGEKLIYATFHEEQGLNFLAKHFPKSLGDLKPLQESYRQDLDSYFRGRKVNFEWSLTLIGTDFQKRVWRELQKIPHGQVTTYKRIAQLLDTRGFQAVGQAVGANPISVIIPCHRVLGTHWFGGYGGGLSLKRLLLELENVTLAPNFQA